MKARRILATFILFFVSLAFLGLTGCDLLGDVENASASFTVSNTTTDTTTDTDTTGTGANAGLSMVPNDFSNADAGAVTLPRE